MSYRFNIRTVTEEDLSGLLELYGQLNPNDPYLPLQTAIQVWRQFTAQKGSEIFIGLVDSKLVATCTLVAVPNLTRAGLPYALIENVVTDALHRKRGYGQAVLRTAIAHAWNLRCYKIMLLTGSKNPATIGFYQKIGFEQNKTGFQIRRPEP